MIREQHFIWRHVKGARRSLFYFLKKELMWTPWIDGVELWVQTSHSCSKRSSLVDGMILACASILDCYCTMSNLFWKCICLSAMVNVSIWLSLSFLLFCPFCWLLTTLPCFTNLICYKGFCWNSLNRSCIEIPCSHSQMLVALVIRTFAKFWRHMVELIRYILFSTPLPEVAAI